ncbi:MAG: rhodanese-like domain-containing protein [Bacteroidota bacterium]
MNEITVQELKSKIDHKENFQLIDVRETHEYELGQIPGSKHIPMGEIMNHLDEIKKDVPVYLQCRSGARSGAVLNALTGQGYTNLYNVKGGIKAWSEEIDNNVKF